MLRGLAEVESECRSLNIAFHLLIWPSATSGPAGVVLDFLKSHQVGCLVADYSPLRTPRQWLEEVRGAIDKAFDKDEMCLYQVCKKHSVMYICSKLVRIISQVDAHNIVPVWETSDKQEYAARTIRGKIQKRLPEFLTQVPYEKPKKWLDRLHP